jgi:hypothetical protein
VKFTAVRSEKTWCPCRRQPESNWTKYQRFFDKIPEMDQLTNLLVSETKKKGRNIISEKLGRKLQFRHQPSHTQHVSPDPVTDNFAVLYWYKSIMWTKKHPWNWTEVSIFPHRSCHCQSSFSYIYIFSRTIKASPETKLSLRSSTFFKFAICLRK